MRTSLGVLALLLSPTLSGCALSSSSEDVDSSGEAIMAGKPINSTGDWVPAVAPLSTVRIISSTSTGAYGCTGELLSSIQILTAAHCLPQGSTLIEVDQYGTTPGVATPILKTPVSVTNIVRPDGVTGFANPDGTALTSALTDTAGDYADLAIATLSTPLVAPVTPTQPGIPGTFSDVAKGSLWEVGTGNINGASNPTAIMSWVPVRASKIDTGGSFIAGPTTGAVGPSEPGDSGGPVYERFGDAILVVGITSYINNLGTATIMTSVLWPANRTWIMSQYVAPPSSNFVLESHRALRLLPGLEALEAKPTRNWLEGSEAFGL